MSILSLFVLLGGSRLGGMQLVNWSRRVHGSGRRQCLFLRSVVGLVSCNGLQSFTQDVRRSDFWRLRNSSDHLGVTEVV
jgi:hypothetical protein